MTARKPPRIKMQKPRIGTLGPRLSSASPLATKPISREERERIRLKERERSHEYRAWYHSKRWQKLRLEVFIRDGYICQQTGVVLSGKHPADNSPVCDHRIPHNGDAELFWDPANLQTISKAFHDGAKQSIERADRLTAPGGGMKGCKRNSRAPAFPKFRDFFLPYDFVKCVHCANKAY